MTAEAPLTVQTVGVVETSATGRLDVAVASSATGASPYVTGAGWPKVICCPAWLTTSVTEPVAAVYLPALDEPGW